ncbi:Uncharacterised protein [uncultured archaeon]|nr:Uncharacterised protein [uncultured archaeon]
MSPIGSQDTGGSKNDAVSIKEWLATSFTVQGALPVKSVGVYMKRLYTETLKNSFVVMELHADDNGKPAAAALAASTQPITRPTLSENWIWFNLDNAATLQPGKYGVVFKVDQESDSLVSDVVNVHYVSTDSTKPGNDYTRRMLLEWDNNARVYKQTTWDPLAYDRTYAVVVSGLAH